MKKILIIFVITFLPFIGLSQSGNPWYNKSKNNNLFFDAIGISHTFGRLGAGIALQKDRFIFGGEYGRYNLFDEKLDVAKFSLTYIFFPKDDVSILGGIGYNIETSESETSDRRKLAIEFGAMRNFERMGVSVNFDFSNSEGRLTLYYNL